jgi:prepilin-type processing-associated H-X9-DG protein
MNNEKYKIGKKLFFCFTLIEMIVVFGIILILTGMLLPTLMKSKSSANSTLCKNNLRQLSLANTMYAEAWGRSVPWGADRKTTNLQRWHGRRSAPLNSEDYNHELSPLFTYLKTEEEIQCPEFTKKVDSSADSEEKGGGGYGYNLYIGTNAYFQDNPDSEEAYTSGVLLKTIETPSTTLLFADTAMNVDSDGNMECASHGSLASWSILNAPFGVSKKTTDSYIENNPSTHFRHLKTANVSWCDGHVSQQRMEWTLNERWKKKNLGFFGSKTDNTLFKPVP